MACEEGLPSEVDWLILSSRHQTWRDQQWRFLGSSYWSKHMLLRANLGLHQQDYGKPLEVWVGLEVMPEFLLCSFVGIRETSRKINLCQITHRRIGWRWMSFRQADWIVCVLLCAQYRLDNGMPCLSGFVKFIVERVVLFPENTVFVVKPFL